MSKNPVIAVLGLGYVGLPLAAAFGKKYKTIGSDIKPERIESLKHFHDITGELSADELKESVHLSFTNDPSALSAADFIIVAVPTPIDISKRPDLNYDLNPPPLAEDPERFYRSGEK